jgi:NAD(P)-dependent dehydrogenase (short-subunit alcohol dehydrogenase family)
MAPRDGLLPVDLVAYNAGNNRRIDFQEMTARQFEDFWRIGCFGGFLVGREAARRLVPLGRGTVIFTGASASLRGKPGYAHFAAAKAGLRMIAQSMAREYGPQGIHVAHVIIDGGVRGSHPPAATPDSQLDPDAIAQTMWHLVQQPRSAWSWEIELRPWVEKF